MKEVPKALEGELSERKDPSELGGPNAEPTGVWRILRNGLILAVVAMVGVAIFAGVFFG